MVAIFGSTVYIGFKGSYRALWRLGRNLQVVFRHVQDCAIGPFSIFRNDLCGSGFLVLCFYVAFDGLTPVTIPVIFNAADNRLGARALRLFALSKTSAFFCCPWPRGFEMTGECTAGLLILILPSVIMKTERQQLRRDECV